MNGRSQNRKKTHANRIVSGTVRSNTFTDCNHGRVDFDANGPAGAGYGTGHMDLTRLTQPAGVVCQ